MNANTIRGLVAVGALTLVGGANAAAVDVAAVVTDIGAQAAPVGLIGVAVLLIYGAVKAFKWVRSALS
ncbi:phage coat protein [Variovorax paradoxus]|nr:phage coat protein [Variovorax paradoxus]